MYKQKHSLSFGMLMTCIFVNNKSGCYCNGAYKFYKCMGCEFIFAYGRHINLLHTQIILLVYFSCLYIFSYFGESECNCVGFEVFRSVVMKSFIFWDMTPCSKQAGGKQNAACHLLARWFLLNLLLRP
jgi:hypothetical protein